ncbi:MAG: hypothetical protein PUD79_04550 [Prevotellaceae bacterium]|nr:hypothetical protein [Prevotellaceae bacterium]
MEELNNNIESTNQDVSQEIIDNTKEMRAMTGGQAGAIAYGIQRISDIPAVNEKIQDCKEVFNNAMENAKETIVEFGTKVSEGIKDYCCGVYENVKDFFTHNEKKSLSDIQFPETAKLNEGITEGREFGLEKCSEAALEIFNPGVIAEWGNMSPEERKDIACMYAEKVAEAFELENYKGVCIEEMEPGVLGSNNGDGVIHISEQLIGEYTTPFQILDTVTHELRHQYQSECINGYHDVSDEVRNEWAVATAIYNYDEPTCFDPWGYSYNPLEIDSNYAGNTVVRNVTSQMFNDGINLMA